MASLDNVSTEDLRQVLAEVEGKKPSQRLMATINYLEEDGATLQEIAERYGYTVGWLSRWFDRLERLADEPFEEVVYDEPSAFLDVDRRVSVASQIRRFATRTDHPVLVVDHEMFLIDRIADRLLVFDGVSDKRGHASSPQSLRDGMNEFLSSIEITFRHDDRTGRPSVNDPGSQLDKEGKESGEYYYTDH